MDGFRIHWASASFVVKYQIPTVRTRLAIVPSNNTKLVPG